MVAHNTVASIDWTFLILSMKFVPDLPSVNLSETPDTLLPTLENRSLGVCPGL